MFGFKGIVASVAAIACTLALSATASADILRLAESGQPLASGHELLSPDGHGVLHCQSVTELLAYPVEVRRGQAPGNGVLTGSGKLMLAGPERSLCWRYLPTP